MECLPFRPTDRGEMPFLSAILLAAGCSRRMGESNKLLTEYQQQPMLRAVASLFIGSPVQEVIVVLGYQHKEVAKALVGLPVKIAINSDYALGMASSIGAGVRAAHPASDGFLLGLGDMPMVRRQTLLRLCRVFAQSPVGSIAVPQYRGRRGHPVLFSHVYSQALQALCGDIGARQVLNEHASSVKEVAVDDPGIHRDFDVPGDFQAQFSSKLAPSAVLPDDWQG